MKKIKRQRIIIKAKQKAWLIVILSFCVIFSLISCIHLCSNQLMSNMALSSGSHFIKAQQIHTLVHTNSKEVRNFSLILSLKHFESQKYQGELRKTAQALSIFKEVRNNWRYVSDPKNLEYIASPLETINHFEISSSFIGDCDDYSVLMSSLIYYIGGNVRLVRTPKHIYPELYIGNKNQFEKLVSKLRYSWFEDEISETPLNYHLDSNGDVWLNLDYTANHPGGEFLEHDIVGILEIK